MTDMAMDAATERIREHLAAVLAAEQRSNAFTFDLGYALSNAGGAAAQLNVNDAVGAVFGYVDAIPAVLAHLDEAAAGDPDIARVRDQIRSCFLSGPGTIGRMGLAALLPQAYAAWQLLVKASKEPLPPSAIGVHQMVQGLLGPDLATAVEAAVADGRLTVLYPGAPAALRTVAPPTVTAVTVAPALVTPRTMANALAVQSDGALVAAGTSTGDRSTQAITVARYIADGHLDMGVRLELSYPDSGPAECTATAVALQDDGRIVVAGTAYQPPELAGGREDLAIARLTGSGDLDPSFGGGGWLQVGLGLASRANSVLVAPDGTIVAAGHMCDELSGDVQICLLRLTADGDLDHTFGISGFAVYPATVASEEAVSLLREPDGRYVVLAKRTAGTTGGFVLLRVGVDGRLDTSFGDGGRSTIELGEGDSVPTALAAANGHYLAAGYLHSGEYVILGVDLDGRLDPAFGESGAVKGTFGGGTGACLGYALAVNDDGSILLGGAVAEQDRSFALAKFSPTGAVEPRFGVDGVVLTDLGDGIGAIRALARFAQPARHRFGSAVDFMETVVAMIEERPDLLTDMTRQHLYETIVGLRQELPDVPEPADVTRRLDEAFTVYGEPRGGDPVERLMGLLQLRGQVARAARTLRS